MAIVEPDLESVAASVRQLLVDEEVAALATQAPEGFPSVSAMHIAADRFVVYVHTFTDTRKYGEMLRDPHVGYVASHVPTGGFEDRRLIRSVQVKGRATLVTTSEEVERAVTVSREQFAWLRDTRLYDNVQPPTGTTRQAFFRIDPVEALWTDHRVRQLWRTVLTFTPDGQHIEAMRPYRGVTEALPT